MLKYYIKNYFHLSVAAILRLKKKNKNNKELYKYPKIFNKIYIFLP